MNSWLLLQRLKQFWTQDHYHMYHQRNPLLPHLFTGHLLISLTNPLISSEDPDYVTSNTPTILSWWMQHQTAILEHFWQIWKKEYFTEIRESHCFAHTNHKPVSIGESTLISVNFLETFPISRWSWISVLSPIDTGLWLVWAKRWLSLISVKYSFFQSCQNITSCKN